MLTNHPGIRREDQVEGRSKECMSHINGKDYLLAKCTGYVVHLISFDGHGESLLRMGLFWDFVHGCRLLFE